MYVTKYYKKTMPAPNWGSLLCIVDDSFNTVPVCDPHHEVLEQLMAENCGLTLQAFFGHHC